MGKVQTWIELPFGDGTYKFRLGLAQLSEIQNRTGDGIGAVFARLYKGRYFKLSPAGEVAVGNPLEADFRVEDVVAVIRQGLLGGAKGAVDGQEVTVDAARVNQLIDNYVLGDGCALKDAWALAAAIMSVTVEGYDPPNEAPAAEEPETALPGEEQA